MRAIQFAQREVYHLYNRGLNKQRLFFDDRDYVRFLFYLLHLQSPEPFSQAGRYVDHYLKYQTFNVEENIQRKIVTDRRINLITFSLMPNHFHVAVQETEEGGISRYMQRVQNAFGKYFNIKNERKGYVFEGRFGAVHVTDNNQLLYLSTYHHVQCRELPGWRKEESSYPWSSYQDYVQKNRWGKLLNTSLILDQFSPARYKTFTDESIAKLKEKLDDTILFPPS
jgi:putative transposase